MLSIQKKIPKVLFIRGVFIKDCINLSSNIDSEILNDNKINIDIDIDNNDFSYDDKLIEKPLNLTSCILNTDYNRIPKVFESIETWPRSTNIHCWYCTNQFNGMPIFIPSVIEPNIHTKNGDKYLIEVEGNYCKWQCAMSYIRETTKDLIRAIEKINNLYFLYKIINGNYPSHIPEAPNKYILKKFGGTMTTDQYYKLYTTNEYNIISND
jgi:hypothetical protein